MKIRLGGRRLALGRFPVRTIFLAGVILGIFFACIGKRTLLEQTEVLSKDSLYGIKCMTVDCGTFFWYVFGKRMYHLAALAVLSTTYLGLAAVCIAAAGYGFAAGTFMCAAALRYGLKGILLAVVGIFPQYLLYVPAFFYLFSWCEQICRGIYFQKGAGLENRQAVFIKLLQLAGIGAAVTAGSVLESYINPALLKSFLKFF